MGANVSLICPSPIGPSVSPHWPMCIFATTGLTLRLRKGKESEVAMSPRPLLHTSKLQCTNIALHCTALVYRKARCVWDVPVVTTVSPPVPRSAARPGLCFSTSPPRFLHLFTCFSTPPLFIHLCFSTRWRTGGLTRDFPSYTKAKQGTWTFVFWGNDKGVTFTMYFIWKSLSAVSKQAPAPADMARLADLLEDSQTILMF
jgi:hypothetical protein